MIQGLAKGQVPVDRRPSVVHTVPRDHEIGIRDHSTLQAVQTAEDLERARWKRGDIGFCTIDEEPHQ